MVVILSPRGRQFAGRDQTLELLDRQKFVPQSAVEALGVAVLPRARRLDVQCLNVDLLEPAPNCMSDELRAVVTADALGNPTHRKELGQRVDHVLAGDAPIDLQRQAFPRVFIDDAQTLQNASPSRVIEHEVPAPHMVLEIGTTRNAAILTPSQPSSFSPFLRPFQPFLTPKTINP